MSTTDTKTYCHTCNAFVDPYDDNRPCQELVDRGVLQCDLDNEDDTYEELDFNDGYWPDEGWGDN